MKRILFFLFISIFISAACKGRDIKPSVDFLLTQNAIELIKDIRDAYERKDDILIKEKVRPSLSEEIIKGFIFKEARVSFTNRMVKITDSDIRVNINWTGKWSLDEKTVTDRGVAIFVITRDKMQLSRIEGDNPFEGPRTAEVAERADAPGSGSGGH